MYRDLYSPADDVWPPGVKAASRGLQTGAVPLASEGDTYLHVSQRAVVRVRGGGGGCKQSRGQVT